MSDKMYLSAEHGLNPSLGVCWICGAENGELVLLGANKGQKASPKTASSACQRCVNTTRVGVIFVEVEDEGGHSAKRTGRVLALHEDTVKAMGMSPATLISVLKKRVCLVPKASWEAMGFTEVLEETIKQDPHAGKRLVRTQFDYERAWYELAKPAFRMLPGRLLDLYDRVVHVAADCKQDRYCLLEWPEKGTLKAAFEEVPSQELSRAAHVIYFHGHWAPMDVPKHDVVGGYWRFSNYADQVLNERLGLSSTQDTGSYFQVREGTLYVCLSNRDGWSSGEIGEATEETLAAAKNFKTDYFVKLNDGSFDRKAKQMADKLWPKEGPLVGFRDVIDKFVEEVWE